MNDRRLPRWPGDEDRGDVCRLERDEIVGLDVLAPVIDGRSLPYVNLDNAATTPPLRAVVDTIERFLPFYSSVHRGSGYTSRVSTAAFEQARDHVGAFVGADPDRDVVVFTKNTTEAINRLARSMPLPPGSVVLTTLLEHHSNDLPWRSAAQVVHVRALADGTLDEDDLDHHLARFGGRVALLAVTGASNVTGAVQPVHRLAAKVHAAGGRILVDAAQLAAHRPLDMRPHDDPGHLDVIALSAHKMYAPFGSGALIGGRTCFGSQPDHPGGGTVVAVTIDDVVWADLPDRAEAGTPNVLGALGLAAAANRLSAIGLDRIAAHEDELMRYASARLAAVPGLTIHGPPAVDPATDKLGVIPFTIDGFDHGLVAAVLGYEHAVGVRSGCFCAHPYIAHLLGLGSADADDWKDRIRAGDTRDVPGMVRISLGCYNDVSDIDRAVGALDRLTTEGAHATYHRDGHGSYAPAGYVEPLAFSLDAVDHRALVAAR